MLAQTREERRPTSAQCFAHHSRLLLFLRVDKLHLRTRDFCWFCTQTPFKSHSDIIVSLCKRY